MPSQRSGAEHLLLHGAHNASGGLLHECRSRRSKVAWPKSGPETKNAESAFQQDVGILGIAASWVVTRHHGISDRHGNGGRARKAPEGRRLRRGASQISVKFGAGVA